MSVIFIQENAAFYSSFDLSGLAQSTPQHDKQIMVIWITFIWYIHLHACLFYVNLLCLRLSAKLEMHKKFTTCKILHFHENTF